MDNCTQVRLALKPSDSRLDSVVNRDCKLLVLAWNSKYGGNAFVLVNARPKVRVIPMRSAAHFSNGAVGAGEQVKVEATFSRRIPVKRVAFLLAFNLVQGVGVGRKDTIAPRGLLPYNRQLKR